MCETERERGGKERGEKGGEERGRKRKRGKRGANREGGVLTKGRSKTELLQSADD